VSNTIGEVLVVGALGAAAALAVNRTVAAYHDGLRTSLRDLLTGEVTRKDLSKYSFGISFGFVVAYALPLSLASGIVVIHLVLLGIDYIGIRFRHPLVATAVGALYGGVVSLGVGLLFDAMQKLPDFSSSAVLLWQPMLAAIPLLPAIAAGHQHGFRWGAVAMGATLGLWGATTAGSRALGNDHWDAVTHGALAAFTMTSVVLVVVAWRMPGAESTGLDFFTDKIARIRAAWPYLIPVAALIAAAAAQGSIAGEPAQLSAAGAGEDGLAGAAALLTAVSYFPVQGMTGLVSGIWSPNGYADWFLAAGFLAPTPLIAAAAGAALMAVELLTLKKAARVLTGRPGITSLGHAIRDSMDGVPHLALVAGGVLAATAAGGPAGAVVVIGASALNDIKGRPVMPLAVPVIAFLAVAVVSGLAKNAGWIS
jgi:hypothetical protein